MHGILRACSLQPWIRPVRLVRSSSELSLSGMCCLASQLERLAVLEGELDERDARIAVLEGEVEEREERISELEAVICELRTRLAENSRNSSRPPSSDGLAKQPAEKRQQEAQSAAAVGSQAGRAVGACWSSSRASRGT